MTVLLTGGAGYIGSHVCLNLLQAGHKVVVVDDFSTGTMQALQRVQELAGASFSWHCADVCDGAALEQVLERDAFDAVVHLAGLNAAIEPVVGPLPHYLNNLAGTITLCDAMERHGICKLVFSSSAMVYGTPQGRLVSEDAPLCPINAYGRAKLRCEEVLRDLCSADLRWHITALRYFNPAGAHSSGRIGEASRGAHGHLISYLADIAAGHLPPSHTNTEAAVAPPETGVHDYIHVVDLAQGHRTALQTLANRPGYHTFNLGTGRGYHGHEVAAAFNRVTQRDVPAGLAMRWPGDVANCYLAVGKAGCELGWRAQYGLSEMCSDTWNWRQRNPNGYGS